MRVVLPEGRPRYEFPLSETEVATISPVIASDREFIEGAIDEMSVESRFARFGQGVSRLSEWELDYLANVDQETHVAWGVALDGEVAGVGRYIIDGDGCAEMAVTVIDRFQQRGLGSALFVALLAVARHDGVHEICFEAQPDNPAVLRMLEVIDIDPLASGALVQKRIRVSDLPVSIHDDGLVEVIEVVRQARQPEASSSNSSDAELTQ